MSLGMLEILRGGGFTTGGLMFDTKLRRQSIQRDDIFHGHIGGMDVMAKALVVADSMLDELDGLRTERYARWDAEQPILDGDVTLQDLHDDVMANESFDPQPASGRQEALENLVNRRIDQAR